MEPLGEYLKEIRESKKLSIEKVIEDTHILKKFIIGIETDDFSIFPGEAYLVGFLRTYCQYLGIDGNEVVRRYERIKLSETPSPIEQLIPKPGFDYSKIIFGSVLGVTFVLLLVGMYFIYATIRDSTSSKMSEGVMPRPSKEITQNKNIKEETQKKRLETELVGDFKLNDKISYLKNDREIDFWISSLEPTVVITADTGKQLYLMGNNFTNKFDIDNDGKEDFEITLSSWDKTKASMKITAVSVVSFNDSSIDSRFFINDSIEILAEANTKAPFTISLLINEESYLKYQIDSEEIVESRFPKNRRLEIKAENQIIFWLANCGAVIGTLKDQDKKINFGELGELGVRIISYTEKNNQYSLQMSSLK